MSLTNNLLPSSSSSRPLLSPAPSSSSHFPPSPKHLVFLIDKSNTLTQILQLHAVILKHGHDQNPILNFKLQHSYSSLNRLRYSRTLFDRTENPNVFFYTAIINAHAVRGFHYQALGLYSQMRLCDVEPNAFTFSSILKQCPIESVKLIHSHVLKLGFESDLYVRAGLVDVYARGGDLESAEQLFDKMVERSLVLVTAMMTCYAKHGDLVRARFLFDGIDEKDGVCWNVMIDGYTQHGKPFESWKLFKQMLTEKVKVNEITVVSVLSACGQLGALESGKWIHSYIRNSGIRINVHVGAALIDMYSKCGSLNDARLVFDTIKNKDVVVWNSMIVGYSMHGFSKEAFNIFNQMCTLGKIYPTDITFIGILNACAHSGLVSKGWYFFNSMKDEHDIQPKVEHYGCMVNLLGRAGHLEEAYTLVKSMKIKPDPVLFTTLLGACRLHRNVDLGEEIVEFLIKENLASSGTYILLSNIYASAGNWDGMAKIRTLMKNSGVQKEPGCSSIEVHNKVHEFLVGDLTHPKSKEIYTMLEEMNVWLKADGYTPQIDTVLHDLGEAQKEQSLEVHSEKLALAFGLISTKQGSPIKIIKNLRVCSDCHAVTKLISKITGRQIVMRDRNRFHHFTNGSCSCGDYW